MVSWECLNGFVIICRCLLLILGRSPNKLSQRTAYRHRDRDHHRRSLVVRESVLKPHWTFRIRSHCGLSALGGQREPLTVILSQSVFVGGCGSKNWRDLVAATSDLVDSLAVELIVVEQYVVLLLERLLCLQDFLKFVAGLASFLAGNIPSERTTKKKPY